MTVHYSGTARWGGPPARRVLSTVLILVLAVSVFPRMALAADEEAPRWKRSPSVWEEPRRPGGRSITGYEEEARKNPPPKEAVLFAGSATIWMWDTEKWFPEYETINRGYGGSMISDNTYFAERIIFPHEPAVIVMYAGDNDVWLDKSPQMTARHFKDFADTIHAKLPDTRIVFISIRPSIDRWSAVERFRAANELIKPIVAADDRLSYADIDPPMLGEDGKPRRELFIDDLLHLTEEGYELWTGIVKPYVVEAMADYKKAKGK